VTVAPLQPGDASARAGRAGAVEDAVAAVPAGAAAPAADPPAVQPAQISNPAVRHAAAADALAMVTRVVAAR
jgi:hypothetical protein